MNVWGGDDMTALKRLLYRMWGQYTELHPLEECPYDFADVELVAVAHGCLG